MKNCVVTHHCSWLSGVSLYGIGGPAGCVLTEDEALRVVRRIHTDPSRSASAWRFDSEDDALTYARARHRYAHTGTPIRLPGHIPRPTLISDSVPWFTRRQAA